MTLAKLKHFDIKNKGRDWVIMLAGTFFSAAGTSMFFTPCKIVDGGITGISTVLYHVFGTPIGISYAIINALLLLSGFRVLGKHFIIKTIIGAGSMSLFMDLLSAVPQVTENTILATLFGGILYGAGRALNFIAGASSGGIDILGRMLQHRFPSLSLGKILLPIDGLIIAASVVVFRQPELVLLGLVGAAIQAVVIDFLMDRWKAIQAVCIRNDVLLVGGMCPDYEQDALVVKNVALKDGNITYVGDKTPKAKTVLDCTGMVVSPGFIDIHMHEEEFAVENNQYAVSRKMLEMGVTTAVGGNCGSLRQPVAEFKRVLDEKGGAPINYMLLAGYNTCRERLGIRRTETATTEQQKQVCEEVKKELAEGACGISFGLEYAPGITYEEMLRAVEVCEDPDYLVAAHYRSDCIQNIDSVEELVRFAGEIRQKFQISHLSSCASYGIMEDALACINGAMEDNPRLSYDTYPYNAWSTQIGTEVFRDGCFEAWGRSYEDLILVSAPYHGVRCTEALFREAREKYPHTVVIAEILDEDDIRKAIVNPGGMIGSDGGMRLGKGHPRGAGTFPRVLGNYVREEKCISLMTALRKMTLEPAKRLNLAHKGQIVEGWDGDITVFDPERIMDTADFTKLTKPQGIEHVFIGGRAAITKGETVNERLGRFLPYQKNACEEAAERRL